MALFKFTKAILNGDPIDVYNNGNMSRDLTYIDDLVHGMRLLIDVIPNPERISALSKGIEDSILKISPFRVVNICNSEPTQLLSLITATEDSIGVKAVMNLMSRQAGDVPATWADTSLLEELAGYKPKMNLSNGVNHFITWYREYYSV